MTRTALMRAYQNSTGRRVIPIGTKERQPATEIPGVVSVEIDKVELERYYRHGVANIKIPTDNYAQVAFIVDTDLLEQVSAVQQAWFIEAPKTLTLHLAYGSQSPKENAIELRQDLKLEGLLITITSLGRTTTSSHYRTKTTPLYTETSS